MKSLEYDQGLIKKNLQKILESKLFVKSKRNSALLNYLVTETLKGDTNKIKEYSIGITVFKDLDFELGKSSIVRNQMLRLRKLLDSYYSDVGINDSVRINFDKGSYIPKFIYKGAKKKLSSHVKEFQPLLAVLPFRAVFPEKLEHEIIDYIADELVMNLVTFSDLRVIASYSVISYFQRGGNLSNISNSLNLDYLLEGKIQIKDEHLLVDIQLIRAESGVCQWAHKFNQEIKNDHLTPSLDNIVSAIIQSIAGDLGIISQIDHKRLISEQPSNHRTELYKVLIRARYGLMFPNIYSLKENFDNLSYGVKNYPNIAELHSMFAIFLANAHFLNYNITTDPWEKANYHLNKAMDLDPINQHVWSTQALFYKIEGEFDKMWQTVKKANSINPHNSYIVAANGWAIGTAGFFDEGIKMIEDSLRYIPVKPHYFQFLYFFRDYELKDYQSALDKANEFSFPGSFWEPLLELLIYEKVDKIDLAIEKYKRVIKLNPDFESNFDFYFRALINKESILTEVSNSILKLKEIHKE